MPRRDAIDSRKHLVYRVIVSLGWRYMTIFPRASGRHAQPPLAHDDDFTGTGMGAAHYYYAMPVIWGWPLAFSVMSAEWRRRITGPYISREKLPLTRRHASGFAFTMTCCRAREPPRDGQRGEMRLLI